jgi:hypothetical protein
MSFLQGGKKEGKTAHKEGDKDPEAVPLMSEENGDEDGSSKKKGTTEVNIDDHLLLSDVDGAGDIELDELEQTDDDNNDTNNKSYSASGVRSY